MKRETIDGAGLTYAPCRYGMSRIMFRGPKRRLDNPYFACIGGTETYGKFIDRPFPALIEKRYRSALRQFWLCEWWRRCLCERSYDHGSLPQIRPYRRASYGCEFFVEPVLFSAPAVQ